MVAIRPQRVQGSAGQKFVVTKRFSGDGYDFVIGDIIIARDEWVHKVPMLIDQRFISQFLSAEDEAKTPINLELVGESKPVEVKSPEDKKEVKEEPEDEVVKTESDEDEIDALAASLLT